jgi:glycerol-3-phosphate dehydrogenase
MREAPDLVERLDFLLPCYRGVKPSRGLVRLGLWLYDRFARDAAARSRSLDVPATLAIAPALSTTNLLGALSYQDARTDDCRLVWRLIAQGQREGGTALNYVRAERLLHAQGRACGVALVDADGASREIGASVVINAAGVWAEGLAGQPVASPKLRPLRGSHLVFPHTRLPLPCAVSFFHPRDRRPVFAYPWQGATLVGTTDLDHREDLWHPRMTRPEADYLMEALDWLMPATALRLDEALSSFAGVRPVVDDGSDTPSAASRESAQWSAPGFIGITGGKLTTFRVTARQVLAEAAKQLPALQLAADAAPLFGAPHDESPARPTDAAQVTARAGEQVRHLDDLLLRRSRAGLVLPDFAEALIAPALAACRTTLGWDAARCEGEATRYRLAMQAQHALPR